MPVTPVTSLLGALGPAPRVTVAFWSGVESAESVTVALMIALLMPPYGARVEGATYVTERISCLLSEVARHRDRDPLVVRGGRVAGRRRVVDRS